MREFLQHQEEQGLLRALRPIERRGAGKVVYNGREYWDLSSNDYLGLSTHPVLIEASIQAVQKWGTGASASRLLSGSLALHHELEKETALFKGKPSALVFNSGYQTNIGLIPALAGKGDIVFSDRLNHASIIDALRLAECEFVRFRHNDAAHLRELLREKRKDYNQAWIITETVFSMDGDMCPLVELIVLKKEFSCGLCVDEAHATGLYGEHGSGLAEACGISDDVDIIMGTFSKALGSFGGYVASSSEMIAYLINRCRSFIFSTALPPSVIAANRAALGVVESGPERRKRVLEYAGMFRDRLKTAGIEVMGESQIVPVMVGDAHKALSVAGVLQEKGFWVMPVREPTVPRGQARLRFTITYDHSKEMIDQLAREVTIALAK